MHDWTPTKRPMLDRPSRKLMRLGIPQQLRCGCWVAWTPVPYGCERRRCCLFHEKVAVDGRYLRWKNASRGERIVGHVAIKLIAGPPAAILVWHLVNALAGSAAAWFMTLLGAVFAHWWAWHRPGPSPHPHKGPVRIEGTEPFDVGPADVDIVDGHYQLRPGRRVTWPPR